MRAVQISEFGGPEVLELVELPDPVPAAGEVLVEVARAGMNFADTHKRDNVYIRKSAAAELPLIPGNEISGRVAGFWIPHLLARPELLAEGISELLGAVACGELEVVIGGVHPLSDVARLQIALAERRTHGKLLLDPSA